MTANQSSRRTFLADASRAVTASWLALELPWLAALAGCAREDARSGREFAHLTRAEARAMRAFAAQIIPSEDGNPGAEEAGAVYFVDRALGEPFFASDVPIIREGLADLDARARRLGARGFASLPGESQIRVLRLIGGTPFFAAARTLVIIGTFADPSHGGNRNAVGWTMIGIEHRPSYTAPFGWYDAQPGANFPEGVA